MSDMTVRGFPHSFRVLTVRGIYRRLCLAVLIPVGFGVFHGGPALLVMVLCAAGGAVFADLTVTGLFGKTPLGVLDGRALYIGLVTAALMPTGTDPVLAVLAGMLAVLVGVWLFGGPGRYWVHPAFVGLALTGVPLAGTEGMRESGFLISSFLPGGAIAFAERVLFEPLGVRISPEAWDLVLGTTTPTGGALVIGLMGPILLGTLIIFGEDLLPPVLPIAFTLAYVAGVYLFGAGTAIDAVFLTSVPFVVVFLLADPGIRPSTTIGMVGFGVLAGGLAALFWITGWVGMPAAVAIFIAGMFVPVLEGLTTGRA